MAAEAKQKPSKEKPAHDKPVKEKKPKAPAEAKAADPAAPPPEPKAKPVEAPRAPADPRLKVLKKFEGRFLPKGVLRERHKAIMDRWNSSDDHGGVTVDELKTLLDDWKGTREKPPRKPKA